MCSSSPLCSALTLVARWELSPDLDEAVEEQEQEVLRVCAHVIGLSTSRAATKQKPYTVMHTSTCAALRHKQKVPRFG